MALGTKGLTFSLLLVCAAATPAQADKIANRSAVFAFLDKVTARISKKEIPLGSTVEFGSLTVTPRACYTRPATEEPKTTGFVEVDDHKLDGSTERIFSGWMLAQSPGLHAVEHPVYDVWLTDCGNPVAVAKVRTKTKPAADPAADAAAAPAADAIAPPDAAPLDPANDPAALEAQPSDAANLDALPVKKRRVKRQ